MKIFIGVGYYFKGISFWLHHRRLWKYAIIPWIIAIIAALIALALLPFIIYYLTQWLNHITFFREMPREKFYQHIFVMALIPSWLLFLIIQNLFNGASLQKLSWKVEEEIAGRVIVSQSPGFWRSFLDKLKSCKDWLAIGVVFLLLNIIPIIGQIAGLGYLCYQTGRSYLGYVYQRRNLAYDKQKSKNRKHRVEIIGLGIVCLLTLMIPVPLINSVCRLNKGHKDIGLAIFAIAFILLGVTLLNVLCLSYNVVGGTLLAIDKIDRRKIMSKANKSSVKSRDKRRPKKQER